MSKDFLRPTKGQRVWMKWDLMEVGDRVEVEPKARWKAFDAEDYCKRRGFNRVFDFQREEGRMFIIRTE